MRASSLRPAAADICDDTGIEPKLLLGWENEDSPLEGTRRSSGRASAAGMAAEGESSSGKDEDLGNGVWGSALLGALGGPGASPDSLRSGPNPTQD